MAPSAVVEEHHRKAQQQVKVAVVTVSDTRTEENDEGGRIVRDALAAAGHEVVHHAIVKDEPRDVRERVRALLGDGGVQVVITTGGTGIAPRDTTYEALIGLIEKRLDGFGEIFRVLSFEDVGSAAMMSRAVAGTVRGGGVVIALPGSPAAVKLAVEKLIVPELGHIAKLAGRDKVSDNLALSGRDAAERLAEDLAAIAARHPELAVPPTIMALYAGIRADVETRVGEAGVRHVARFSAGARSTYAELAVIAGQLATAAR